MAAWDKYGIWGGVVYADTLRGMPYWGCLLHPYSSSPAVIDEINCSDDRGCPAKHAPPAQLRSVARPAHLEPQQAVRPKTRPADAISIWNCVGEVEAERRGRRSGHTSSCSGPHDQIAALADWTVGGAARIAWLRTRRRELRHPTLRVHKRSSARS
jgi:hypothetical protein